MGNALNRTCLTWLRNWPTSYFEGPEARQMRLTSGVEFLKRWEICAFWGAYIQALILCTYIPYHGIHLLPGSRRVILARSTKVLGNDARYEANLSRETPESGINPRGHTSGMAQYGLNELISYVCDICEKPGPEKHAQFPKGDVYRIQSLLGFINTLESLPIFAVQLFFMS